MNTGMCSSNHPVRECLKPSTPNKAKQCGVHCTYWKCWVHATAWNKLQSGSMLRGKYWHVCSWLTVQETTCLLRALISGPLFSNRLTVASHPVWAARCNAVLPCTPTPYYLSLVKHVHFDVYSSCTQHDNVLTAASAAVMSAPALSMSNTAYDSVFAAAKWRVVLPCSPPQWRCALMCDQEEVQ